MAPPTPPSDSTRLNKVDASNHPEHSTNLLDLMSDVKKNALAPAFNSFAVEPINVAGNIINFTTDVVTSGVNKLTGANHKALQVGKVTEMEVGKAEQNSVAGWSQQIFGTAGSFLAYATAGKIAGRVMRTGGELLPVELEYQNIKIGVAARALAQDTRVANVLGATTYAGLKDPHEGESRLSNAASTLVGFSFFEAGNTHFVNPASSAMFKLGQRYTVGSLGGIAQVNVASIIQHGQFADASSIAASGLSGGVLNALLPGGRRIADAAVENRIIKSIPHVTDATARLYSDAVKSLPRGRAPEPGSWADPKAVKAVNDLAVHDLDTRLTVDDAVADARGSKAKSGDDSSVLRPADATHESAGENRADDGSAVRRKRGKKARRASDPGAESEDASSTSRKTKKSGSETQDGAKGIDVVLPSQTPGEQPRNWIDQKANVIHHGSKNEPLDVVEELAHRKIFKDPSYEQQFQAHAQEIVSKNPADPRNQSVKEKYITTRLDQEVAARATENEEAAKLGLPIRVAVDRDVIRYKEGYGSRFEQEANLFVSSGGKTRPEIDFSGGSAARMTYAYIEEPAPIVTSSEGAVTKPDDIKIVSSTQADTERPTATGTTDGVNLKPPELVIVAGTDSPAAREAARVQRSARIENWERSSNQIIRSSVDPKDRPQNALFNVVRDKLNSTGLARDGWVVLPTESGSPLDQVGCDYALVNLRKNQVIFLDATQNQSKINNPGAHNVSELRSAGVIGFESRWLDMIDRLKVDDEGAVGRDARQFDADLGVQLKNLTDAGSPITIDMLPSATRQGMLATQGQVDEFRTALLKRSAEYSVVSRDRQQLEDYARDLERGAAKYNEFQVATKPSVILSDAMQRQSDKVVLNYVLNKLHIKAAPEILKSDSKSVRINKDGHMVITVDNIIYDGGDVKESLTESRRNLRADSARLEMLLQRDKSVLNKMRTDNLTLPQVMRMVQEEIVSAREIDNGMLGERNIGLDEILRGRIIQQNLEDAVAGRTPKVVEKPVEAAPKLVHVKAAGFTPDQQVEIPKMAKIMSDFGLKVQDGVDPNDLKAFVEMYAENANSQSARELAATYAAEIDKPISEQRLIPRLNGALVAAQMRVEYQLGAGTEATPGGASDASVSSAEASRNIAKKEKALIAETSELPFEQVKLALQRLNELQASTQLGQEEQFQLDALQAFKSHMLDASVRSAIMKNLRALAVTGTPVALGLLSTIAIRQWYDEKLQMGMSPNKY